MADLRDTGGDLIYSYALSLLAESHLMAREDEKGLASIAEALRGIETSGQRMHEAELWRLRGELLGLHRDAGAEAERSFHHALKVAQTQQARSWELRATTSLARLLRDTSRRDEARTRLAEIYNWFTEGFDTADLKEAKVLLDELGG
jgi:predicted ATPase